ncbi:hypothetical protein ACIPPJ_35315 [Streptomyces sp. NPDC086091]|uniref:hypothetical protein n=1 Tax=Streptomyces TaxID=1883 RepID=UPI0038047522
MGEYANNSTGSRSPNYPPQSPDLKPVEDVWSLLGRGPLANTAFTDRRPSRTHPPPVSASYSAPPRPGRRVPCRYWTQAHTSADNTPKSSVTQTPGDK